MSVPTVNYSDGTLCDAISDMIAALAMTNSGISHIVNANGELLQYFIFNIVGVTPDLLVTANNSVQSLVNTIVPMEQAITACVQALVPLCDCETCEGRRPR